jgi:hypothetical protein
VQPGEELCWRKMADTGGGQFDSEWEAVQLAADSFDLASVCFCQGKLRLSRLRTAHEQLDRG